MTRRLAWAVALVSAGVLGFEISLLRLLLVVSWHHFAFLVISVALLGFGASGTLLVIGRKAALRRGETVLLGLVLAAAAAMPVCTAIATHVPLEARVVPALLWRQAGWWIVGWAVLATPFLLGGAVVGLALMLAPRRTGTVYGANLVGSAAGALAAPALMLVVAPAWLPAAMGVAALAGGVVLAGPRPRRLAAVAVAGVVAAAWLTLDPPRVRPDPYKYVAYLQRLADQGSVSRVAAAAGPRAFVEAWRGEALHDLPFLAVGVTPPPIAVLVADGHLAGSVLEVSSAAEAEVVDRTLMAVPYDLLDGPRTVALLGETGGVNIWLARRHGATTIDVIQPDRNIPALLRGPLEDFGGAVLDEARIHAAGPRRFIERARRRYDLVQLVTLESSAAGSGGVGGLGEDHLVTVEGIEACLDATRERGLVAMTRGIQTPPRDNVKLLATVFEALRRAGARRPATHVAVVRDYLAVCTMVSPTPLPPQTIRRLRSICRQRELTPVWFEGVAADELNRPDALPEAPDGVGDEYHYAVRRLAGDDADAFVASWAFDVRPPTDDRPFFLDFCRLRTVGALRDAYGDLWLTRAELGFLFVLASGVVVAAAGAAATVVPLPWLGGARRGRGATVAYFGALGLGYLLLEMVVLSRLTFLIGDPVRAASLTICVFLLCSGLGSMTTQRLGGTRVLQVAAAAVAALGLLASWTPPTVAAVAAAPLAFLMGFPMPLGLRRLAGGSGSPLVPWAWGVNGFASVLAPPLALAIAMSRGYLVAAAGAAACYAAAAVLFSRLPAADR